jgi:hypothetical protein
VNDGFCAPWGLQRCHDGIRTRDSRVMAWRFAHREDCKVIVAQSQARHRILGVWVVDDSISLLSKRVALAVNTKNRKVTRVHAYDYSKRITQCKNIVCGYESTFTLPLLQLFMQSCNLLTERQCLIHVFECVSHTCEQKLKWMMIVSIRLCESL